MRLMRAALDKVGEEENRYIRLCNYCSGLCMPEIAAMGALERLDVMLNDALYGILFRDINMQRTLVDQYFSRIINGFAGVIINTGEDNYLTTADAVEEAHTVLASQFLNEQFALMAGLPEEQQGLGHAFEISPDVENGQRLHLLGMMTEAIHTPFMSDRALAIENAQYIFRTMKDFGSELEFKEGGIIQSRANEVLQKATDLLVEIEHQGLFATLEQGIFADIKRPKDGGKGLDGVVVKDDNYFNPFITLMKKEV